MEQIPSGEVPVANLPGMGSLLARTWVVYKQLLAPLFVLSVFLGITFLITTGITSLLNFLVLDSSLVLKSFIEVINTLVNFVSLFVYSLFFTAMLYVIKHRGETILTVGQAIIHAKPVYRSLLWISILAGLAAYGSAITVVLPILMLVWLYFAIYVLVSEERRGVEALARSRYLTRGVWFATLGRYLAMVGIVGLIALLLLFVLGLPAIGGVLFVVLIIALTLLVIPFFAVFDYLRYEDLVALPRNQAFHFFRGERNMIIFFAVVGLIIGTMVWISSLLTCEARTNVVNIFKASLATVLLPVAQNASSNIAGVFTAMEKVVYVYTPDACLATVSELQNRLQYDPSLYDSTNLYDPSDLNLQPAVGADDLSPSGYPALNR